MIFKRLFDIVVASGLLLLLAPVFLAVGLAVKCSSRGPIFCKMRRVGKNGHPFCMYVFWTAPRASDDQRLSQFRRLLRKTYISELPQLLNVLKGEMSLVGPKPELPEHVRTQQFIWQQVLSVRPGICGLAQLAFAMDEAEVLNNLVTIDRDYVTRILPVKLHLDLQYINKQSLLFDLKLLIHTILLLVHPEGRMRMF